MGSVVTDAVVNEIGESGYTIKGGRHKRTDRHGESDGGCLLHQH